MLNTDSAAKLWVETPISERAFDLCWTERAAMVPNYACAHRTACMSLAPASAKADRFRAFDKRQEKLTRAVVLKIQEFRLYSYIFLSVMVYLPCMALSIKSSETERLAREIAVRTGESLTGAIQTALQERLERLKHQQQSRNVANQLREILRRVDQLPLLDSRTPDEIVGYDENGLPR